MLATLLFGYLFKGMKKNNDIKALSLVLTQGVCTKQNNNNYEKVKRGNWLIKYCVVEIFK